MRNKSIPFYIGAIGLVIFLAASVWQSAGTRTVATTPPAVVPMPNLDGEKAKQFLAENGLDKSLGAALQTTRYGINRIENAATEKGRGAFEAKNSEQEFAARFSGDGVNLVSQTAGEQWNISLDLKSFGRGARQLAVNRGQWSAARTKISASHQIKSDALNSEFQIDEWFENKPEGLEQSFIIHEKIDDQNRQPADRSLKIVLGLGGDLQPEIAADGQTLIFKKDGAQILRYDKLQSWDAGGRELASRMELAGGELALVVDDAEAVYPVTVDPTFTQVKKLIGSDSAAQDAFGFSVAVSGNTAIVGAIGHNSANAFQGGAAYIFERNAGGANNFGEVKKLTALDGTADDRLGWSVAIDGSTAVIGAVKDDNFQGAAYVYERNQGGANNWGQVKKLVAAVRGNLYSFGNSVSIRGDHIAVGSPLDIPGSILGQGSVSIFGRNQGGTNNWGAVRKVLAADGGEFDQFGYSVALSGSHLVVGANLDDSGANTDQGAAYIFERSTGGADNWGQVKKLAAADGGAGDNFGFSVNISGDTVIVGAPRDDLNANTDQGSAYIFEQNSGGAENWGQVKKLTANDGAANDAFGSAVAVSGDNFLVGAYLANLPFAAFTQKETKNFLVGGGSARGAGYIFRGSAAALAPTAANVGVGGRVLTADGRGISSARVTLTDARGESRRAISNSFGYYRFTEVRAGEIYVFSVTHKGYQFAPRVLTINESLAELDFTAEN